MLGAAGVLLLVAVAGLVVVLTGPSSEDGAGAGQPAAQGDPSGASDAPTSPGATATASTSASASPTPSPSSRAAAAPAGPGTATGCASQPSACGYPDATNTGVPAGTALTVVNGDLTITAAGTVVEGKEINGCVLVKAPNVTIRRSKVHCAGDYAIGSFTQQYSGGGLLIEDVEVDCADTSGTAIADYGTTARRVNIHGCENGFDIDTNITVEDSYIHDLHETPTAHTDGIQVAIGEHIVIRHNTIFNPGGTSAIINHPTREVDVLITNNLLAGGAYTLYCPRDTSTDVRVIGNRFSTRFSTKGGAYGPLDSCGKVAEFRDNVWDETLKPVVE
jgi:hypothetical protein